MLSDHRIIPAIKFTNKRFFNEKSKNFSYKKVFVFSR